LGLPKEITDLLPQEVTDLFDYQPPTASGSSVGIIAAPPEGVTDEQWLLLALLAHDSYETVAHCFPAGERSHIETTLDRLAKLDEKSPIMAEQEAAVEMPGMWVRYFDSECTGMADLLP